MDKKLQEHLIMQYLEASAEQREAQKAGHTHIESYNQGLLVMILRVFQYHKCEDVLRRLIPNAISNNKS